METVRDIPLEISRILGLNKQEIAILNAISGMALPTTDIARRSKIPRTSLLYMLRNLEKRNLVKAVHQDWRIYWKSNTVNAFRGLKNTRSEMVILNGVDEILTIFDSLINLPCGSRVLGIQPDNSIKYALRKVNSKKWNEINNLIKENKLIIEGVVHEKSVSTIIGEIGKKHAPKVFDSFIGRLEDYVKIPDDFSNVSSELYIFGGSVYIINWQSEVAIQISDHDIVKLLTSIFYCVKELGTRYSQNKKMEIYKKILNQNTTTPPNTPQ